MQLKLGGWIIICTITVLASDPQVPSPPQVTIRTAQLVFSSSGPTCSLRCCSLPKLSIQSSSRMLGWLHWLHWIEVKHLWIYWRIRCVPSKTNPRITVGLEAWRSSSLCLLIQCTSWKDLRLQLGLWHNRENKGQQQIQCLDTAVLCKQLLKKTDYEKLMYWLISVWFRAKRPLTCINHYVTNNYSNFINAATCSRECWNHLPLGCMLASPCFTKVKHASLEDQMKR